MGALTAFLPKRRGRIEQMDWMGKRLPAEPTAVSIKTTLKNDFYTMHPTEADAFLCFP